MKIELELEPWQTPNFVRIKMPPRTRQEGISFDDGISIKYVDPEVLAAQCDNFRKEVFKKAGKIDPNKLSDEGIRAIP